MLSTEQTLTKLCCLLICYLVLRLSCQTIGVTSIEIPCFDYQQRRGFCRPIGQCKFLLQMINAHKANITEIIPFLTKSQEACAFFEYKTLHCCRGTTRFSCGDEDVNKIAHGQDAGPSEFPWMALLTSRKDPICGGTLLDEWNVLTAAHCIKRKTAPITHVALGVHDSKKDRYCWKDMKNITCIMTQTIPVEKSIAHQSYFPPDSNNDIAIIHLKLKANLAQGGIQPICLPLFSRTLPTKGVITGWGYFESRNPARILQKADVYITDDNCTIRFSKKIENSFCIKSDSNAGTCQGDSGGPLVNKNNMGKISRFIQYGITTGGPAVCNGTYPSMMLDVSKYIPWIIKHLKYA